MGMKWWVGRGWRVAAQILNSNGTLANWNPVLRIQPNSNMDC